MRLNSKNKSTATLKDNSFLIIKELKCQIKNNLKEVKLLLEINDKIKNSKSLNELETGYINGFL